MNNVLRTFFFALMLYLPSKAQILHHINNLSDTVTYAITEIDSIRFDTASNFMQVVLQEGSIESFFIDSIYNVNFISAAGNAFHTCGADSVHNQELFYGTVSDQDGNIYKTVVISGIEWMAENLKTSSYQNGDALVELQNEFEWAEANTGAWCMPSGDVINACPYGSLYNALAVSDSRNICPVNWHIPNETEWNALLLFFDSQSNTSCINCIQSALAGTMLKSAGTAYWQGQDMVAVGYNISGFSALPGGFRGSDGTFSYIGQRGAWWSADSSSGGLHISHSLDAQSAQTGKFADEPKSGFSVRCVHN